MRRISTVIFALAAIAASACATHHETSGATGTSGTTTATSGTTAAPPAARATPPALTPADLEAAMKKIGPAYASVLKNLQGTTASAAAGDAKTIATEFGTVEKFWAQHNKPDAVKWAQDAGKAASDIAGAAAANDAMKAQAASQTLGAQCKSCHTAYREGTQQSGFKVKAGAI